MKTFFKGTFCGVFFTLVLITSVLAEDKAPLELTLVPGGQEGPHVLAGLLLKIPQSWHVYAPNPGGEEAAGFEPSLEWTTSSNLQNAEVLWPKSRKTTIKGELSYVYEGETLIPLRLTPHHPNDPITLNITVSLLACSTLCVPIEKTLSLRIEPNSKADQAFQAIKKGEKEVEGVSLLSLLFIALLGGFILNFMPCVLPVLSLKVIALIKHTKKTHLHETKQGFFITGIGILASFLLLALLTIILKESGESFGWGIHFQNPHFLLFVFLVLIAFSASLLGVFEIDLPSGLGTWLISHEGKGKIKDFLSGVFATLLATPCSAPFMGTALSFALARNIQDIILVFFFLGLGFASPYFLVAVLPQRLILIPKPGKWMMWLQYILGIILILTALWIGWILSFHLPLWILGGSLVLTLLALFLFWIKHYKNPSLKAWAFAGPLFLIAWGFPWVIPYEKVNFTQKLSTIEFWQDFAPDTISALVNQGKIVFVDVTAEWCVTCAVNKALVLNDPKITSLLTRPDVVAMRADWTKQDPRVTQFLHAHGRYGIPFNIIFGPKAPDGLALPEVFTIDTFQETFKKVSLPPS